MAVHTKWKSLAATVIDKLPDNGASLRTLYRKAVFFKRRCKVKARIYLGYQSIPDPETVYWIDPKRIIHYTNYCGGDRKEFEEQAAERIRTQSFRSQVFDRVEDKGRIYGGDWDISEFKLSELEIFKALELRINHQTPWEETDFFKTTLARIEAGELLWQCRNKDDLVKRCKYIDRLIDSIKEHGYKLNNEVSIEGDDTGSLSKHSTASAEILVNIGRDGQYLFQDGRHRLAIAQILNLELVPVKVLVRHKEWQGLRELLSSMIKGTGGASKAGVLYQSPLHPDLLDFPTSHNCGDRFTAIKPHIEKNAGRMLDIGANLGYFCHMFEELGYDCCAVEIQQDLASAANKIRAGENRRFKVINGDLFEVMNNSTFQDAKFKVVLTLNILHHLVKTEARYNKLVNCLEKLDIETMFFEPHESDDPQMQNAYKNFNNEEFIDFIFQHTALSKAEPIYRAEDGRTVYKLYK